jgi:hypothetical protein
VRVRTIAQRQSDDLVELAVLNERLAGDISPWEARTRLELLRKKRKNWEHIVSYVTRTDAALTLQLIEEANERVRVCGCAWEGARPRVGACVCGARACSMCVLEWWQCTCVGDAAGAGSARACTPTP